MTMTTKNETVTSLEVDAIGDGAIYLRVDPTGVPDRRYFCGFEGEGDVLASTPLRVVHVMSRRAGGEIRGFVVEGGRMRKRLPDYVGDWPEMDLAVLDVLTKAGILAQQAEPTGHDA